MKYILRHYAFPRWPSEKRPPKDVILAVGEKQFIRAARKQAYRARCIFDSDCVLKPAMKDKIRYEAPHKVPGVSEKHYHSIEALLADNFEIVL